MLFHRSPRLVASGFVGLTLAFSTVGTPSTARAASWQEMHQTDGDVRLDVGADGTATVMQRLRYRVVAGHFKTVDVVGIDPRAEVAPEAVVTADKGGVETVARTEPVAKSPGTIRLMLDDAKGLGRGTYLIVVKYRVDLVATKMFSRDGGLWKLAWTAPPALEGQDGARVIFDLPAAPTEPRLAASAESTTTVSTLRRGVERDELELVRAHVPRGEAAIWAVRVDPKAFPQVTSTELRPPPPREIQAPSMLESSLSRVLVPIGLAALAGALAALLRAKQRSVRAAASTRNAAARPLLPLPGGIGPFVYGVVGAFAFAMLLWSSPIVGALLVAFAMALAAHRAPLSIRRPRGPGAWRRLADPRALLPSVKTPLPSDGFDLSSWKGRVLFGGLFCVVLGTSLFLRPYVPQIAIALPLAAMALVPVFITGTRAQMCPSPAELAAKMLRPTRDALASAIDLSHVELDAIVRVIDERGSFDEVRLVCAPRDRTPGLRAIELASATSLGGHAAVPEVLLRFDDGSAAADRVRKLAGGWPVVPGRTPDERVVRLVPPEPTPASTAGLLSTLLLGLEGRRATDRTTPAADIRWKGRDRRNRALPPSPPIAAL